MVFGLVLSFSGGSWDITYHILNIPESFFSYPHSLVYSGILIVVCIFFMNLRRNFHAEKKIRNNNYIILSGIVLVLAAGPFDFSWHSKFGLDGLLSPPHLTLLSGWLLVALGNLRITNFRLNELRVKSQNLHDDLSKANHNSAASAAITTTTKAHEIKEFDSRGHELVGDDEQKEVQEEKEEENDEGHLMKKGEKTILKNQMQKNYGKLIPNSIINGGPKLYKLQLFLNLSILLLIMSGILYFFSLPFSETEFYNFNPPSLLALFVYGLGFPILFSAYLVKILLNYPDLKIMVPLVGIFYVIVTLITQISSNSFLAEYSGYYLLNLIPFVLLYAVMARSSSSSSRRHHLRFKNKLLDNKSSQFQQQQQQQQQPSPNPDNKKIMNVIFSHIPSSSNFKYLALATTFGLLSYSLCFPLNTYVYNEELYGYLIYQNLVVKVYQEIFFENYVIIAAMSVAGGFLGYMILHITKSMRIQNHTR